MASTTKVPRQRLAEYFATFAKRFLRDGAPEAVDIEILEPNWGDQFAVHGARLIGITYDPSTNALEFELDAGDHRVYEPTEVWTIEESDGFVSAIEVVRPDSSREVVSVKRVGVRRLT